MLFRSHRVITPSDVIRFRAFIARQTHVSETIREYIVRVVRATRPTLNVNGAVPSLPVVEEMVLHGASPRAAQHLLALARTTAFFQGRDYVLPADVKRIAPDALRHRLIRTIRAEAENVSADEIIAEVLNRVPIA